MSGVVLVHGFTGAPAAFDRIARRLQRERGARVHQPCLLGHGADAPPHLLRFEQEVDRLAAGVVAAGFSGAHLCGYSLGARLALGLLARHAFLFQGATLIGVHPGLGSEPERAARVGSDERWCRLLLERGLAAFLVAWQAQPLFATQQALPASVVAEQQRLRAGHTARGLARSLRVLGLGQMPDYRGALRATPLPVRLVAGGLDGKFVEIARGLAGAVRGIEVDVIEGVGHNVVLEAPARVEGILLGALAA